MKALAALSLRYLWSRPLTAALNLLLLTLGLASITFVMLVSTQVDRAFERDLAGIDAVVGAKGSPLQLILAGVFHIDVPPGNIACPRAGAAGQPAGGAGSFPSSLGDSYRGFRIVGTTPDYITHYGAQLAQGALWAAPMQAVAGAQAARAAGLCAGRAVRWLPRSGRRRSCAWRHALHRGWCAGALWLRAGPADPHGQRIRLAGARESYGGGPGRPQGTAGRARNHAGADPLQVAAGGRDVPRFVNTTTDMQAAAPAVEVTRLLRMVGVGTDVLRGFGAVLLLAAALSVFIALWGAVRERRADLALLRMLGASPARVAALLVCEALWLALLASVLGLALGHLLTGLVGWLLQAETPLPLSGWLWVPAVAWVPLAAAGVAMAAALIPALHARRMDVAQLLNTR